MLADVHRRLTRLDLPSPYLKQLPTTLLVIVGVIVLAVVPGIRVTDWVAALVGLAGILVATILGIAFTFVPTTPLVTLIVPGIDFLALGAFRAGTGGTASLFSALVILPVLWIAAEPGRRYIFVAAVGTSLAQLTPYLVGSATVQSSLDWMRGVFTPVVFAVIAAIVNEMSRQGRLQVAAIQSLGRTAAAQGNQLREHGALLHAAERLSISVLAAVTEQFIIGTDLTGLIGIWNPGASAMLGVATSETVGKRFIFDFHLEQELEDRARELNYPPGATVLNPGFSALVESARLGRAEMRDWTYVRPDGSHLTVEVAVTPRVDDSGETVGYIFVGTDVTQALEVSRLKDEFVGLISHELRTPLSSILGYLELMRDDDAPLSEEQQMYLGVAERNAHRLLHLVGDLLFTAQVAAGKFPIALDTVDLAPVVAASVESAKPSAATKGVTLVSVSPTETVEVNGDAMRLGQALDNLISNAIKFTPSGGTVTVSLSCSDSSALIAVRDTGMGVAADEVDRLTARFFRASTATRNAVPGVGLGLAITKAIVTAHAGELTIESEEGVGTVFRVSVPLSDALVRVRAL